jgi:hypothetical protein
MANWNLPAITSGYLDFVTELNNKFVDAGTIGYGAPTNLPERAMRFNRTINIFEEWIGGAWVAKVIGIAGGGTGATDPNTIRTNLGLGSMSTQNSNAVAITGGTITGVAYSGSDITSGIVALARGGTGSSLTLPPAGHIFLSNGTNIGIDSGVSIYALNASSLAIGIVPDARLSANVAMRNLNNNFQGSNEFAGYVTFTHAAGANSPTIVANPAILNFFDAGGVLNERYFRIAYGGRTMYFQSLDDAYSGGMTYFYVTPFGMAVGDGTKPIYADGAALTNLNGSAITTGIVNAARLASNAPTTGYFLRSDNTWQPVTTASVDPVPSGLIGMFLTGCPAGWTRVAGLDSRFPIGSPSPGLFGGSLTHLHRVDGTVTAGGTHRHHATLGGNASGTVDGRTDEETNQAPIDVNRSGPTAMLFLPHSHRVNIGVNLSVSVSGDTDDNGNHQHTFSVDTQQGGDYPPYMSVVYCQKN